jgi:hypothetical protein
MFLNTGLPNNAEDLQAFVANKEREIKEAREHVAALQREAAKKKRFLTSEGGAVHLDNAVLGAACKKVRLRDVVDRVGEAFNLPFFMTTEGLRVSNLTIADVLFILQQEAEEDSSGGEEPAGREVG